MLAKFYTLGLAAAFFTMIGVAAVTADYTGLVNIRDRLPDSVASNDMVKKYIDAADYAQMTPSQKHKRLMAEEERQFRLQQQKLARIKDELDNTLVEMAEAQKKMEQERERFEQREAEFSKEREQYEKMKEDQEQLKQDIAQEEADQLIYEEKLQQLVKIYERMEPEKAAEVFNNMTEKLARDLLFNMKDKKAAAIMDLMNPDAAAAIAQLRQHGSN